MVFSVLALQQWLSWPASPGEVRVNPTLCPRAPNGTMQTAAVALDQAAVDHLFAMAAVVAAAIALVAVFITYQTRRMGLPFVTRWTKFAFGSAAAAFVGSLALLLAVKVGTVGCEYGDVAVHVPFTWALFRSVWAGFQAFLFFVLWSVLLTWLFGRWLKVGRWYDNHRVPYPFFIPRA